MTTTRSSPAPRCTGTERRPRAGAPQPARENDDVDYCGCCGHEMTTDGWWCVQCSRHVGNTGHLWDRTYLARTGQACPFEDWPRPTAADLAKYREALAALERAEREAMRP